MWISGGLAIAEASVATFRFNSGVPRFKRNPADQSSDNNLALNERFDTEPFLERASALVTLGPPA
jgi:hypothetical protein